MIGLADGCLSVQSFAAPVERVRHFPAGRNHASHAGHPGSRKTLAPRFVLLSRQSSLVMLREAQRFLNSPCAIGTVRRNYDGRYCLQRPLYNYTQRRLFYFAPFRLPSTQCNTTLIARYDVSTPVNGGGVRRSSATAAASLPVPRRRGALPKGASTTASSICQFGPASPSGPCAPSSAPSVWQQSVSSNPETTASLGRLSSVTGPF